MFVNDIFADNVREFRVRAGLSQEGLAEKSGMHRTYIGSVEQKRANISLKNVERIAEALEVDPAILFVDGAAAREDAVANYTSTVDAVMEKASDFDTAGFGLCEWADDGTVRVEPISVYSEDLTLRILCILIEEGYGETLDDLIAAYDEVSGPILEFVRSFKSRELIRKQQLLVGRKGIEIDEFGQLVGAEEAADSADADSAAPANPFDDYGEAGYLKRTSKIGEPSVGSKAGAPYAATPKVGGPIVAPTQHSASEEDFKSFIARTIKEAVAEYFDGQDSDDR